MSNNNSKNKQYIIYFTNTFQKMSQIIFSLNNPHKLSLVKTLEKLITKLINNSKLMKKKKRRENL